jgi:phage-related holin
MKEFWNTIQLVFAAIGGWLGYFLGGCDGLLIALADLCRCATTSPASCVRSADKKLSSGGRLSSGICRKVLIFILVGIANMSSTCNVTRTGWLRPADGSHLLLHLK